MSEKKTQAEILLSGLFVAKNYGFLTGSRAFGCSEFGSDYDIVTAAVMLQKMPDEQLNPIDQFIADHPELSGQVIVVMESPYQNGKFYHFRDSSVANIVPVQTLLIPSWIFATNALILYTRQSGKLAQLHGGIRSLASKEARVALFEQFRASFRLAGGYHGLLSQDVQNLIAQQNRGELYG